MTAGRVAFNALTVLMLCGLACSTNIWEQIQSTQQLSCVADLLQKPELIELKSLLSSSSAVLTAFLPMNDACERHDLPGTASHNPDLILQIMKYHIVNKLQNIEDMGGKEFAPTLMNDPRWVKLGQSRAQVVQIVQDEDGNRLQTGVDDEYWTAFIVKKNIPCSNGMINIIDNILHFPRKVTTVASIAGLHTWVEDIVEVGLAQHLNETPDLTLIVPNDQAWEDLTKDRNVTAEELREIVKTHIVKGAAYSPALFDGRKLMTEQGEKLKVEIDSEGKVSVNGLKLVDSDVLTFNGVIHSLSKVLIPASLREKWRNGDPNNNNN